MDVHALHAALERGYLEKLPKHAQRQWSKPLHKHPFDYETYQRESGRTVESPIPQRRQQRKSSTQTISKQEDTQTEHQRRQQDKLSQHQLPRAERGVQCSPPTVYDEVEPLEQYPLASAAVNQPSCDEVVQTDDSFLSQGHEDECIQVGDGLLPKAVISHDNLKYNTSNAKIRFDGPRPSVSHPRTRQEIERQMAIDSLVGT